MMSPCIKKCRLVKGICANCFRTKNEIINWINIPNKEKEIILSRIEEQKEEQKVK